MSPLAASSTPWVAPSEEEIAKAIAMSSVVQPMDDVRTNSNMSRDVEENKASRMRFPGHRTADQWTSAVDGSIIPRRNAYSRFTKITNEDTTRKRPKVSEIDAKIAAAEARTDTKFAELMGELKLLRSDLSGDFKAIEARIAHVETSTSGIKSTVVTTGIVTAVAVLGLVVAIFGWGSQMFGVGMTADSVAKQAAQAVQQSTSVQFDALNARQQKLETDIGALIQALQSQAGAGEGAPVPHDPGTQLELPPQQR